MEKIYEKYMVIMGSLGSLTFYLQAYKIFVDKSATNVSLAAFMFGMVSVVSWLIYGILLKNKVLIISNLFATIGAALVIIEIFMYA